MHTLTVVEFTTFFRIPKINGINYRDLRIYMAVGGMPQAVEAYVAGKNFSEIDMVKRQIITLYEEDFKKNDASGRLLLKSFYLVPFISA